MQFWLPIALSRFINGPYSCPALLFRISTGITLACLSQLCWSTTAERPSASQLQAPETPQMTITRYCGNSITPGNKHIERLITLAFEKIDMDLAFKNINQYCSHSREMKLLQSGESDILWAATSREYEEKLIPVRIPIYKGLLGYRIGLVRSENKDRFKNITTMKQLQTLKFGQGEGWADTSVLKAAGLDVTTSSDVFNLFKMLNTGRFDLFPRGLMEPWKEVEKLSDMDLAVEEHLMIVYPLPAYIFVTPKRPELAILIQEGLELAIKDGSFDKLVFSDPDVREALKRAKLTQRKVFYLMNPTLSKETPLNNKALWADVRQLPNNIDTH